MSFSEEDINIDVKDNKCYNCETEILSQETECPTCGLILSQTVIKLPETSHGNQGYIPIRMSGKGSEPFNQAIQKVNSMTNRTSYESLRKTIESYPDIMSLMTSSDTLHEIIECYNKIVPAPKKGRKNISILAYIIYTKLSKKNPKIFKNMITTAMKIDEKTLAAAEKKIELKTRAAGIKIDDIHTGVDERQLKDFKKIFTLFKIDEKYLSLAIKLNRLFNSPSVLKYSVRCSMETRGAVIMVLICNGLKMSYNIRDILDTFTIKEPSVDKQLKQIQDITIIASAIEDAGLEFNPYKNKIK
jgi:hypothetical protein